MSTKVSVIVVHNLFFAFFLRLTNVTVSEHRPYTSISVIIDTSFDPSYPKLPLQIGSRMFTMKAVIVVRDE